jgi:hypothetical protein
MFAGSLIGVTQTVPLAIYQRFATAVSRRWRYTRDTDQEAFLAAVLATSVSRQEPIAEGMILWRAQEGCDWPESDEDEARDPGPRPYAPSRMRPLRDRASDGRVNPRGIPCLYVATHQETAVAEVRPWMGAYVSVAQLKILRPLVVVNCTSDDARVMIYGEHEPEAVERERACWQAIDQAFARPVDRSDHLAEYVPTQVIAEMFRRAGLDGIGYRSSLGPGHNVALFDLDAADVINCGVYEVRSITFGMESVGRDARSLDQSSGDREAAPAKRAPRVQPARGDHGLGTTEERRNCGRSHTGGRMTIRGCEPSLGGQPAAAKRSGRRVACDGRCWRVQ